MFSFFVFVIVALNIVSADRPLPAQPISSFTTPFCEGYKSFKSVYRTFLWPRNPNPAIPEKPRRFAWHSNWEVRKTRGFGESQKPEHTYARIKPICHKDAVYIGLAMRTAFKIGDANVIQQHNDMYQKLVKTEVDGASFHVGSCGTILSGASPFCCLPGKLVNKVFLKNEQGACSGTSAVSILPFTPIGNVSPNSVDSIVKTDAAIAAAHPGATVYATRGTLTTKFIWDLFGWKNEYVLQPDSKDSNAYKSSTLYKLLTEPKFFVDHQAGVLIIHLDEHSFTVAWHSGWFALLQSYMNEWSIDDFLSEAHTRPLCPGIVWSDVYKEEQYDQGQEPKKAYASLFSRFGPFALGFSRPMEINSPTFSALSSHLLKLLEGRHAMVHKDVSKLSGDVKYADVVPKYANYLAAKRALFGTKSDLDAVVPANSLNAAGRIFTSFVGTNSPTQAI